MKSCLKHEAKRCVLSLLSIGGVVPYHPNAEGMEEAAKLVLEAL